LAFVPSSLIITKRGRYPEYKERGLVSLIVELSTLVKSAAEKKRLESVINDITNDVVFTATLAKGEKSKLQQDIEDFTSKILKERWKKHFPFTSCSTTLFC